MRRAFAQQDTNASTICDPLSENSVLRVNTEFEIEAILSVQVVSQITYIYCTNDSTILNYEAQFCYYDDDISSSSWAAA